MSVPPDFEEPNTRPNQEHPIIKETCNALQTAWGDSIYVGLESSFSASKLEWWEMCQLEENRIQTLGSHKSLCSALYGVWCKPVWSSSICWVRNSVCLVEPVSTYFASLSLTVPWALLAKLSFLWKPANRISLLCSSFSLLCWGPFFSRPRRNLSETPREDCF